MYYKTMLVGTLLLPAAIALVCLANTQVHCQTIEQRQRDLRGIRRDRPQRQTVSRAEWSQVAEEYKALQLAAYKLTDALNIQENPDYRTVKSSAGEIKKRAQRIENLLILPEVTKAKRETEPIIPATFADLHSAIDELTEHISNLVTNPIFEHLQILDVQQSEKAHQDLIEITRLSSNIKRGADLLKRRN